MGRTTVAEAIMRLVVILLAFAAFDPAAAATPPLPQPPTYARILFPTVPKHFCSEAEYWKFINEVMNPPYLQSADNAQKAAKFRADVEQAVNANVQSGLPVPADLQALRRRAHSEYAEHQRISNRMAQLRATAGRTPIIDCSKQEETHGSVGAPGDRFGIPDDMNAALWAAYSRFEDARERCDQVQMAAALAELERLAKMAQNTFSSIAGSLHGGPFDQAPTPENIAFHEAEAEARLAKRLLARARTARARECYPCIQPTTPALRIAASPPVRPFVHAERALANWVNETDRLFDQLGEATLKGDCERIKILLQQISARFGQSRNLWWAALIPAQYRLKWKWIFLRSAEACRPPPETTDWIMDEIDHVPVISQAPTDRTAAALLAYHNRLRAEAGSPPLRWSAKLAGNAAAYARALAYTGQLRHASREGRQNERENIIVGRRGGSSPMAMAMTWGNEKRLYRGGVFPNVCASDWSTCGHYTQMVWSTTRELGCAYASGTFVALVCRYSPPGNRDGRAVVEPGLLASTRRLCPLPPLGLTPPPP